MATLLVISCMTATAHAFQYETGGLKLRLNLIGALQGAYIQDDDRESSKSNFDGSIDFTVRATGEYAFRNGWVAGLRVEYDRDFDAESDADGESNLFERDEIYAYLTTPWVALELGEQDGPADRLSFHAPTVGLGQIRGNFSRYVGSNALLSPFDTQDSPKFIATSAPVMGVRVGASYGTTFRINANAEDRRRSTIQKHPVEVAVQFQDEIRGVIVGVSGAFVTANADPETEREDIRSWSLGTETRYKDWRVGAAIVERGDSNSLVDRDETEINYGLAYTRDRWGVGLSGATIDRTERSRQLGGLGGFFEITRNVEVRADVVHSRQSFDGEDASSAFVAITEIEVRF